MLNKIPDVYVGLIRQVLVGVGTPVMAKYGIDAATTGGLVDALFALGGAAVTFGSMAWMVWTKAGTRAVPIVTAERKDVPTVNAVTGSIERTTK